MKVEYTKMFCRQRRSGGSGRCARCDSVLKDGEDLVATNTEHRQAETSSQATSLPTAGSTTNQRGSRHPTSITLQTDTLKMKEVVTRGRRALTGFDPQIYSNQIKKQRINRQNCQKINTTQRLVCFRQVIQNRNSQKKKQVTKSKAKVNRTRR